jgi:hypothetical protein
MVREMVLQRAVTVVSKANRMISEGGGCFWRVCKTFSWRMRVEAVEGKKFDEKFFLGFRGVVLGFFMRGDFLNG